MQAVNRGRQPLTPANKRCARCQGPLEPSTDGSGNNVNTCQNCGQRHQLKIGPVKSVAAKEEATPSQVKPARKKGRRRQLRIGRQSKSAGKCGIGGCYGELNAKGTCPCCEKRKAFANSEAQPRACDVCGGKFVTPLDSPDYYSDHCPACRPIAARAVNEAAEAEAE